MASQTKKPGTDSNGLSKSFLDFNKKELDKFFSSNIKTSQAVLATSALGILLFIWGAFNFNFKDKILRYLYPKKPSEATLNQDIRTASLNLQSQARVKLGQQFIVLLNLRSDQALASSFSFKLKFSSDKIRLTKIDTSNSFIPDWPEKTFNNSLGTISLSAKSPTGYKTSGTDTQVVSLEFKAMQVGQAEISLEPGSSILSDKNQDILNTNLPKVTIQVQP